MAIIFLAILTSIIGVLSFYLWTWSYWKRRGIAGPSGYPILGSALEMLSSENPPYLQLKEWTKQYGKVYGITEGLSRTLVISDPDLVQEVFVKQYDNFFGRKLNPIQGDPNKDKRVNLFSSQGHRWKRLRTISSPTFSNNSLRKLKTTVEECAVELLRHIEQHTDGGQPIDLLDFYQEFTLDVIGRIAMGQTDSQMFKNPLLPYVRAVFGEPRKGLFLSGSLAPWIGPILRMVMFSLPNIVKNPAVHVIRHTSNAVEQRVKLRMADEKAGIDPGEPQDFIDLFLDAKSDDVELENNEDFTKAGVKVTRQLTTEEIVGQCFVFLIAGFDTTALSLSYSSFLLATHPKVQKKLQEEIDRECADPEVTFDQLSKLKYMECVIKETLRMYPLGALANSRCCMRATKIGNYEIDEGTNILCDTWTLHSDKSIWGEDAEEFKPERWESGDEHFYQKGGYIPFGLGPRQCIGMRLAYMEEKLLLSHILRKYTLEVCNKTQIPLKLIGSRTTQPESVWLNLTPRDDN
ncbi:Cytochrome P450 [Caenorhabditis elegans]|uniref:Cytochrome P450 n=1 Tax=Caenorhabditis elegans TaxID=6239 RepID=O17807_CAEEL|nr:Cytochrome P450 [Caenorhabditis elegans]CAB04113.1 Cytochrome P450 [Caenorhabditis elegans]|eukprot:NP_499705.1 CYtochrome P450 family [Caenorhabditis elegans]